MIKELTCIICPNGCNMKVEIENEKVVNVEGNTCKRGYDYAQAEITAPTRTITTTVKLSNGKTVSVKTNKPVPKQLIFNCMDEINKVCEQAPVEIGKVIIKNILNTGADVVSTQNVQ